MVELLHHECMRCVGILVCLLILACGGNDDSSYIGIYSSGDGSTELSLFEDKTAYVGGIGRKATWSVEDGEIVITYTMENPNDRRTFYHRIENDGKLTSVARSGVTGRKDIPEVLRVTFSKVE